MELNKFILGQKVRVKECEKKDLIGKIGYVIDTSISVCGVEFDEFINGHSCHEKGTDGCCWWFALHNLEEVKENQGQIDLGKFKDVEALKKAYLDLEKEFSRRNQAYKEHAEAHNKKIDDIKQLIIDKADYTVHYDDEWSIIISRKKLDEMFKEFAGGKDE